MGDARKLLFYFMGRFMAEVCFLGTGGAAATKDRDNTALVLAQDDDLFLIDCPGGVFQKLKKLDLNPRHITSILITHTHPDHIYGLPSLIHSLMLDDLHLPLFATKETIQFCRQYLDLFRLQGERIRCRIDFVPINSGDVIDLSADLRCQALHVPHMPASLAFHFRFLSQNRDLIYSGDTPIHKPLFKMAAGVDTLIHDCSVPSRFFDIYPSLSDMHTNALDLGRFAQEAKVKRLIPCHFFGELDYDMTEVESEIRENYTRVLIIPYDMQRMAI